MACDLNIPKSIKVVPDPCGKSQEIANWDAVRIGLKDTRAHTGTASENWRYPTYYPSHNSFPATPARTDLSYVVLTDGSTVYLPCPRSCDPNVVTGDFIVYELDCEDFKYAVGGYQDCAIGTIKMWSDGTSSVRPGWKALEGGSAPDIHTRTGKWPTNAQNKFPLNRTSNILATCADTGVTVNLTIDDHVAVTDVLIDDHPLTETSEDPTDISVTMYIDCETEDAYTGIYGYVDLEAHAHLFDADDVTISSYAGGTPVTVAAHGAKCTSPAMSEQCGSPVDLGPIDLSDPGHHHDIYCEGYVNVYDPWHSHAFGPLTHNVTADTAITPHSFSVSATRKIPYVVVLMIMRYNNAANAVANTSLESSVCGLDP